MKKQRGFTLVELTITMAIMVILMAVAIVSLRSSQANARDAKRASDIETIARGLEQRYNAGMVTPSDGVQILVNTASSCSTAIPPAQQSSTQPGNYPTTDEVRYAEGTTNNSFCPTQTTNFITEDLPGSSSSNYTPPNGGSLVAATSVTAPTQSTAAGLFGNNYYYLPLDSSGSLCSSALTQTCTSYTLYYISEADGTLHAVRSKHQ